MVDFVMSIADFPFAIVEDGKSHDFVDYTIKKAVTYLETLAESYIIIDTQRAVDTSPASPPASENPINQTKGLKNKISMTFTDFQSEEGNYEFTVEEEKGNVRL